MKTKDLAVQAFLATLYVALTLALASFAYGNIQFRIAEFLLFTVLISTKNVWGLLLGCVIVNLFSPLGMIDVVFGTFATALTCFLMVKMRKKPLLAFMWPAIINGLIVGSEIYFFGNVDNVALWVNIGSVFIGEFMVTFVPALFILKPLLNNKKLVELLS